MGIIMKFIGNSKKNNAQKREHNLLKPTGRHTEVDAMNGGRLVQGDTRQCVYLCLVQVGGHGTRDDRAESRATERAVGR